MHWTELAPIPPEQWVAKCDRLKPLASRVSGQPEVLYDAQWWRIRLCWDYLRVSPSYQLVHRAALGQINITAREREEQALAAVERTYAVMGDVYSTEFKQWFWSHSRSAFGMGRRAPVKRLAHWRSIKAVREKQYQRLTTATEQWTEKMLERYGDCGAVLVAVPTTMPLEKAVLSVNKRLSACWPDSVPKRPAAYTIDTGSKARPMVVWRDLALVRLRAQMWDEKWWKVAAHFAQYVPDWQHPAITMGASLKRQLEFLRDDSDKRRLVGIELHRSCQRALVLAENAARGTFPSSQPLTAKVAWDFDGAALHQILLQLSLPNVV